MTTANADKISNKLTLFGSHTSKREMWVVGGGGEMEKMGILRPFRVFFLEWMVDIKRQKNGQDWVSHMGTETWGKN